MGKEWYALHSKPHKERQVASLLRSRNLEVFLPLLRVNPVNPRAARERPYFPNYLFAHVDLDVTGLSLVQWTPGLLRMVEFGGVLGTVPGALIAQLKQRMHDIRAAGGLVLQGLCAGDRVRVLLELIGDYQRRRSSPRAVPVDLNVGNLARLGG
jgi:transcriptional antiterminator RfaH